MTKPHTIPAYDHDLAQLRELLTRMASRAELMLAGSLRALEERNVADARRLVAMDSELDALEMAVDNRSLHLLARWQPVASDLRFVATALKAVTDLERIGDHAVNICERVLEFEDAPPLHPPVDVMDLGRMVQDLIHDALQALRSEDVALAGQILERGPRADVLVRQVLRGCFEALRHDPEHVHQATSTHEIAGYLQRIAAHATNIAEMVIFLVRGEDVRHHDNPPAGPEVQP
jgi:phosphate transport system protein